MFDRGLCEPAPPVWRIEGDLGAEMEFNNYDYVFKSV